METVKFESNQIFEINGSSKIKFEGTYTPLALSEILIKNWIPYYECHKCGKGDYCKFTIAHPANPRKKMDIQCGVAVEALTNFISRTIHLLENTSNNKKQNYLDSAFYLCKYILASEQLNGSFIDKDKLDWWGDHAKQFYAEIIPIRDVLNDFSKCLKEFPEMYEGTCLLLVEGESEITFIENIRGNEEGSKAWFFIVKSYKGKGNKIPSRIKMLLDDYKEKGYAIYIQGDEDGTGNGTGYDKFTAYVNDGYLPKENIFQFKQDFETSIPKKLLYRVLLDFGHLTDIPFDEFDKKTMEKSMNESLKSEFGIDTTKGSLKKRIAKQVGKALFYIDPKSRDKFKETELGQFVRFLDSMRYKR